MGIEYLANGLNKDEENGWGGRDAAKNKRTRIDTQNDSMPESMYLPRDPVRSSALKPSSSNKSNVYAFFESIRTKK